MGCLRNSFIGIPRLHFRQCRKLRLVIEYLVTYAVGLIPSKTKLSHISHENDCLMWGIRVIVPTSLQSTLNTHYMKTHPGMKSLARSYFWWNGMDKTQAKSCAAAAPSVAPLHPSWKRIHIDFEIDFAGPFLGKKIIVDAIYTHTQEKVRMDNTYMYNINPTDLHCVRQNE